MKIVFVGRSVFVDENQKVYCSSNDGFYWESLLKKNIEISFIFYENILVTSSKEYSYPVDNITNNYKILKINNNNIYKYIKSVLGALDVLKNEQNSLMFFYFPNTFNIFLFYLAKSSYKISYWGNEWSKTVSYRAKQHANLRFFIMKFFIGYIQKSIIKKSRLSIFAGKDLYEKYCNIAPKPLLTKPYIVIDSNDKYYRDDTCQNNTIKIMYAGTFTKRKGINDLLDVFYKLTKKHNNIELILVGKGELDKYILEYIKSNKLENKVILPGYIGSKKELMQWYRKCDMFVLASYMEGFPRVLYESMSQSLPIITTDVGGIAKFLNNNEHALFFKPGDKKMLEEHIDLLISDRDLRQSLICKAYSLIDEIIDEPASEQHFKKFKEVLNEN